MTVRPDDELVFLPLGGSNEIGMNFNCYGYGPPDDRKWIIVDVGVTFGDQTTPGVEIILPDPPFIEDHADDILGIVLTHAHEDHIGAMGWLWPRLKAPIYATPFTAFLLREKLRERGSAGRGATSPRCRWAGPSHSARSRSTLITLTHSIPEPNGLAIRTPLGTVLHTGDWKIDPDPLLGGVTDRTPSAGWATRACWPWSATPPMSSSTARPARRPTCASSMNALIGTLKGKVAVACFASNVARMHTAIRAAEAGGRRVCLVGRSMIRMAAAAASVGLFKDVAALRQRAGRQAPCPTMRSCTCAPAARARRARPWPGSPTAPIRTCGWGRATTASSPRG